eukprot:2577339-Prymnesium_polylepis.1
MMRLQCAGAAHLDLTHAVWSVGEPPGVEVHPGLLYKRVDSSHASIVDGHSLRSDVDTRAEARNLIDGENGPNAHLRRIVDLPVDSVHQRRRQVLANLEGSGGLKATARQQQPPLAVGTAYHPLGTLGPFLRRQKEW